MTVGKNGEQRAMDGQGKQKRWQDKMGIDVETTRTERKMEENGKRNG